MVDVIYLQAVKSKAIL